jgi:hypothetical protein
VKHAAIQGNTQVRWLLASTLALSGACDAMRPRVRDDSKPRGRDPLRAAQAQKLPPVGMPGAIPREQPPASAQAATRAASIKSSGKVGELLEADVYYFKVRSLRTCDASGKVAGVEVEIEAKAKLAVSPRDVVIGKGGITFSSGLNFERKFTGCAPLLGISVLNQGEITRGFVIFDLPRPPEDDLMLVYQPTRWGGAGYVRVPLRTWSGPP